MKNFNGLKRFLALALCLVMLCAAMPAPAFAWGYQNSGSTSSLGSFFSGIRDWWDRLFNGGNSSDGSVDISLVEDETTVSSGTQLRADTYLASSSDATIDGKNIKYFPVTMYNYDDCKAAGEAADRYNKALRELEHNTNPDGEIWDGIYFGQDNLHGANVSGTDSYTYPLPPQWVYTVVSVKYNKQGNYSQYTSGNHYVKVNNDYYVVTAISCIENGVIFHNYDWTITYSTPDGQQGTHIMEGVGKNITLYTRSSSSQQGTDTRSYAGHNRWTDYLTTVTGQEANGGHTYSGLVQNRLDYNNNIIFNKPEAGLFTLDRTTKDVYTGVEMPFVYDENTHYYTLDSDQYGVYFSENASQGTHATPSNNGRLFFTTTPQTGGQSQDGNNGWYPFNNATNVGTPNYFFGMRANIPFTMTSNGRLTDNDPTSDPIIFDFSGDDDVWVFVDGILVLDIGGIHNAIDGVINFAENTWSIKPANAATPAGDINNAPLSGKLFNDEAGDGVLGTDRTTFAARESHELTIFYLERGAGASNCKIEFNLPMKDYVSVTKRIDKSKTADGTTYPLTAAEQAMVDAADFRFTLYKDGQPVANRNYNLLDVNGQYLDTRSTNANGQFTIKNGQTARFIGDIDPTTGNSYYVVEENKAGYVAPDFTHTTMTAGNDIITESTTPWQSATVQSTGSDEAEDNIQFVCENYLDAQMPNPSLSPEDDFIVIDYGLPVVIPDVRANDTWKGDSFTLDSVTGGSYGTAVLNADNTITYTLNTRMDGVDVLTYTATVTGGSATITKTGKVYVIPATSMYYEEDFGSMVTYSQEDATWAGWTADGTDSNTFQEGNFVGYLGDSPYGSDVAYRDDAQDSNGTVMSTDTTGRFAYFRYTFKGTGTAFFARIGADTGHMRIVLEQSDGNGGWTHMNTSYRDTVVLNNAGTFYNIPVYDISDLDYGHYRITVTLARKGDPTGVAGGAQPKFYLDGIRVYNPLSSTDANYNSATEAYATDGEANNTIITIRDKVISAYADGSENFISFTDTNGAIDMAEYISIGPKNELYLNYTPENQQHVTFALDAQSWDANAGKVYLGIKAPQGLARVRIGSTELTINHAADSYYDITEYGVISTQVDSDGVEKQVITFTITATEGLVSLTRLKVTGIPNFVIIPTEDVIVPDTGSGSDEQQP